MVSVYLDTEHVKSLPRNLNVGNNTSYCLRQSHNGSTMPTMWVFGQSHIDLAWLWTTEETRRKAVRTYANQLTLMDEYPEYRFLLCEPALLDMLREQDGDCWQRVRHCRQVV